MFGQWYFLFLRDIVAFSGTLISVHHVNLEEHCSTGLNSCERIFVCRLWMGTCHVFVNIFVEEATLTNIVKDVFVYLVWRVGCLFHVDEEFHLCNLFGRFIDSLASMLTEFLHQSCKGSYLSYYMQHLLYILKVSTTGHLARFRTHQQYQGYHRWRRKS